MSPITALVRVLCRWLPADERRILALDLGDHEAPANITTEAGSAHTDRTSTIPDWEYIWNALGDAALLAGRIAELLSDKRAFVAFTDILNLAEQLRAQIDSASELMCDVQQHQGLGVEAGDHVSTARRLVDIRRAKILDTELGALNLPHAHDPPTWLIDYREHGGFIATRKPADARTTDGSAPWKFWGYAPTAHAAAHALRWYFLDNPPAIKFEPHQPAPPLPWTQNSRDADLSLEGPSVSELILRRGRIYDEHLAACRSAREILRDHGDVARYLGDRAAELNTTDPQLPDSDALEPLDPPSNPDHGGSVHTVQWVPTHLVVSTEFPTWGDFEGHRDHSPFDIIKGLITSNLDAFTMKLFACGLMLVRVPGWAGPLYTVGNGGNHRIHTARMLNLPWLAASISTEATAVSWPISRFVFQDRTGTEGRHHPYDKRVRDRVALIEGLLRRGVIDGELTHDGRHYTLHSHTLPAAWLLRAPHRAAATNAVYETRYPGALERLGIPVTIGTDPDEWTRWLTTA